MVKTRAKTKLEASQATSHQETDASEPPQRSSRVKVPRNTSKRQKGCELAQDDDKIGATSPRLSVQLVEEEEVEGLESSLVAPPGGGVNEGGGDTSPTAEWGRSGEGEGEESASDEEEEEEGGGPRLSSKLLLLDTDPVKTTESVRSVCAYGNLTLYIASQQTMGINVNEQGYLIVDLILKPASNFKASVSPPLSPQWSVLLAAAGPEWGAVLQPGASGRVSQCQPGT